MMKHIFVLLALFSVAALADRPNDPEWPNEFTIEFEEEFNYKLIWGKTNGTFYYDFGRDGKGSRYSVQRQNGKRDRYCGFNGLYFFRNTPCNQYVDENGDRYLYYPERDDCCFCCSAAKGCGVLKRTWVQGAEYLGEVLFNGNNAYKWDQKGLQSNIYIETVASNPDNRIPLQIDQQPNDKQTFNPATFKKNVANGILDLPSKCDRNKACSFISTCNVVENYS